MARTVAGRRGDVTPAGKGPKALTGQEALDKLMGLTDIHGRPIDGPMALVILGIAREIGVKVQPVKGGLVRITPAGRGYTVEVDS